MTNFAQKLFQLKSHWPTTSRQVGIVDQSIMILQRSRCHGNHTTITSLLNSRPHILTILLHKDQEENHFPSYGTMKVNICWVLAFLTIFTPYWSICLARKCYNYRHCVFNFDDQLFFSFGDFLLGNKNTRVFGGWSFTVSQRYIKMRITWILFDPYCYATPSITNGCDHLIDLKRSTN